MVITVKIIKLILRLLLFLRANRYAFLPSKTEILMMKQLPLFSNLAVAGNSYQLIVNSLRLCVCVHPLVSRVTDEL